ncbi:MAG TPA: ABC transporter ATP-binding protein [Clostridiaceae bacterium]|nr:ABC transporter ATP-binding protein [Clostridiaceae bacterium]
MVLEIKGLSFSIDERKILKNIDLKVEKGEFIGLIGPNGAGKSTLLKCINGINKAEGSIKVKGCEISKLDGRKIAREISLMHQDTLITFPFQVIDVVLMGRYPHNGRLKGESLEDYEIARRYMKLTETLELSERKITNVSGGERQRVLFAKTLTQETGIILLDEPTASLDIAYQEQIFDYARELSGNGKTVIAAVHDLKIAARYCNRLILMKDGIILADGKPAEVLTAENLKSAYGVNAIIYRNSITGQMDFYISKRNGEKKGTVHVIGGGGSASGVMRYLFERGYTISSGVLWSGDSDLRFAEVFGIKCIKCDPFCEISEEIYQSNVALIKESEFTIISNMPFGNSNIKNLEAALNAKRLVIIEDEPPEIRDYTEGKALTLYNELKSKAIVTTSARLHEIL